MKKNTNKKQTLKKESRIEKLVVTLLVVLVSLLSFSVGVISGKGLSDKEYALKSLDEKYSHALNEETTKTPDTLGNELSDEEIEELANAALENAEAVADESSPAEKASITSTGNTKNEVVVADTPPEERIPSSINKMSKSAAYTVQIAAFTQEKDAQARAKSLIKKGYAAFPLKVLKRGKTWYRVSIGSFKTRKAALAYQRTLANKGVARDSVIQPITR